MTARPPAQLVLLACVSVLSLWPRCTMTTFTVVGHPDPSKANRLALFEHVLHNDAQWRPVLKQRVRLSELDLPKYRETEFNKSTVERLQLVAKDVEEVTAMHVLQTLIDKSAWLGTNVDYAAIILSTAMSCFTYTNAIFVLNQVNGINQVASDVKKLAENHDQLDDQLNDQLDEALDDVRKTFIVFVDALAALESDLNVLADGLYDYDSAADTNDYLVQLNVLNMVKDEIETILKKNCYPTTDSEVYGYLNVYDFSEYVPSDEPEAHANAKLIEAVKEFNKVIDKMIEVYHGLDVKTMPIQTWSQILQYKVPIVKKVNFFTDVDPPVEDPILGTSMIPKYQLTPVSMRVSAALEKVNHKKTPTEKRKLKNKKKKERKQKKKNNIKEGEKEDKNQESLKDEGKDKTLKKITSPIPAEGFLDE